MFSEPTEARAPEPMEAPGKHRHGYRDCDPSSFPLVASGLRPDAAICNLLQPSVLKTFDFVYVSVASDNS